MRVTIRLIGLALSVAIVVSAFSLFLKAQSPSGSALQMLRELDAAKGKAVFQEKGCFECHSYDSKGTAFGPDLGTDWMRGTSPAALAAAMWNHAPSMWRSMGDAPTLNIQEAAALFSFFYSQLYFNEAYPDARRGEHFFEDHCASCHDRAPGAKNSKAGPPVSTWGGLKDTMALAGLMWNHSTTMLDRINRDFKPWPRMKGQDVTDLLAYLWRVPEVLPDPSGFQFGNDQAGEELFKVRCAECHTAGRPVKGLIDLSPKLRGKTLPDVAASMWNHAPAMKLSKPGEKIPSLTETQMRDLLTYLIIRPGFDQTGDPGKGSLVFLSKGCAECHEGRARNTGAPPLSSFKGPFDPVRITTVLWSHGPAMLAKMKDARIPWPRFKEPEMLDLLAYLNSKE